MQNKNRNKLRTKSALLGLWAGMLKNYRHICNQRPPICLIAKFRVKIRILKHGTKNAFCVFWRAILKNYCPFRNQHPQIRLIPKFGAKTKILKFSARNV